jgi:hypothetical protein
MKPSQFSIRWLLEVTVIAAIYAVFVRGAIYSAPPYCTYWQILLVGLTIQIVIGSIQALANGTFFHHGGKAQGNSP